MTMTLLLPLLAFAFASLLVAAAALAFAPGGVTAIEQRLGLSPRVLIERFRGHAGLTPKRFARIERFQRADVPLRVSRLIGVDRDRDAAEVAADAAQPG